MKQLSTFLLLAFSLPAFAQVEVDRSIELTGSGSDARITAVSYTHLRAHETVLDLVCRLLLEKNKNK